MNKKIDATITACGACGALSVLKSLHKCQAKGATLGRELIFIECTTCGFSFAPDNFHHYASENDFAVESRIHARHGRVGNTLRAGREYQMANMAYEILLRAGISPRRILVYGPGLSMDHTWIAKAFPESSIFVSDLENFQNAENFLQLDADGSVNFDIIVACEVAEHFVDIQKEFRVLLSKLSESGMAVLSTNINDKRALGSLVYPFIPGHTAYYSSRSLTAIARRFHSLMQVDFRTPEASLAQLGPP